MADNTTSIATIACQERIQNSDISNNPGTGEYVQDSGQVATPFSVIILVGNTFENNGVQVAELNDTDNGLRTTVGYFDMEKVVSDNDFDRAGVVRANGDVNVPAAFNSVRNAVDAAADGDIVHLAAGTYTPSSDLDFTTPSVTFVGAG